jgi:hypothetical protein
MISKRNGRAVVATTAPAKIEALNTFDNINKSPAPQRLFAGIVLARRFGIRLDRATLIAELAGIGLV